MHQNFPGFTQVEDKFDADVRAVDQRLQELKGNYGETRPSRPIRCDVWIVERLRYPTDQPTDRPTDRRTQPVIEVLCRT